MKEGCFFTLRATESEHSFLEDIFFNELFKRGFSLIYYRKFKTGHIPLWREAKTDAPRWVVLDICKEFSIDIETGGFTYKNGIRDKECQK